MIITEIKDIPAGGYMICSYTPMRIRGATMTYCIKAINVDDYDEKITDMMYPNKYINFWATKTLADYIIEKKPIVRFFVYINTHLIIRGDPDPDSIVITAEVVLT
jgi:hypothetical protein